MLFWHVPAPNEALLISGSKRRKDATQFRILTGHGSFEPEMSSASLGAGTCQNSMLDSLSGFRDDRTRFGCAIGMG